jgi:hypothetical protein
MQKPIKPPKNSRGKYAQTTTTTIEEAMISGMVIFLSVILRLLLGAS